MSAEILWLTACKGTLARSLIANRDDTEWPLECQAPYVDVVRGEQVEGASIIKVRLNRSIRSVSLALNYISLD